MKTRHLFATAALASLFAACSQEELVPSVNTGSVSNRPVVGTVDIVSADEVVTRYNVENCTPEAEDAIGLYLMDEFSGYNIDNSQGELNNANWTRFEYQSNWWTMYKMVNYIQSNYGYEYMPDDGKWINRASQLVEGNYMVMFPKNDAATNRRDLWHEIKPVVDLKHHSTIEDKYYVGRDNQFMLDYQQVYRAQEADKDGNLTLSVKLKPILTYAKFVVENQAVNRFIAQKLVFKAPAGKALPTVAYVKPAEAPGYESNNINNCPSWLEGPLADQQENDPKIIYDACNNPIAWGLYEKEWFTQDVARSLVKYATTEELVPYGLENETVAYEYTFQFPDEGEGGVRLEGNSTSDPDGLNRVLTVSLALPAFEFNDWDWTDMEVVIYGKMWDPTVKGYRSGLIKKMPNKDNAEFQLDQLKLWKSGQNIPVSNVHFDDDYFYQAEEIRVATTADLLTLIDACLSNASTSSDINFDVHPYGNGLEITDEVVAKLNEYQSKNGVNVTMTFKADLTQGSTPVILKAENCIDRFKYNGVNVTIEAEQTSTENVEGISQLINNSTLTINAGFKARSIINTEDKGVLNIEGTATDRVKVKVFGTVFENDHELNVTNADIYVGENAGIANHSVMNVDGLTRIFGGIFNSNNCVDCGKTPAKLVIVGETSQLIINWIYNENEIENNGILEVIESFRNLLPATFTSAGTSEINQLENDGLVSVTAGETVLTGGNNNRGTIEIAANTAATVEGENSLANLATGIIRVSGDLMENIQNSGQIFVIGNGHVGVDGIVADMPYGIIDVTDANNVAASRQAKDKQHGETNANYFRYRVGAESDAAAIQNKLAAIISANNYGKNPIILVWDAKTSASTLSGKFDGSNVQRVIFDKNLTFGSTEFKQLNASVKAVGYNAGGAEKKMVSVTSNSTLTVDNGATLTLEGDGFSGNIATVYLDGTIKFNNTSVAAGEVKVFGTGRIEFNQAADNYADWTASSTYTGKWLVD